MVCRAFNSWLFDQLGRLDAVGQLSRDAVSDRCWPTAARAPLDVLARRMREHRAPAGAKTALRAAHLEWRAAS